MRGKGSSLLQITRSLHQFTENNGCMPFYCTSRFDCRTYTNLMWMCSSGGYKYLSAGAGDSVHKLFVRL